MRQMISGHEVISPHLVLVNSTMMVNPVLHYGQIEAGIYSYYTIISPKYSPMFIYSVTMAYKRQYVYKKEKKAYFQMTKLQDPNGLIIWTTFEELMEWNLWY